MEDKPKIEIVVGTSRGLFDGEYAVTPKAVKTMYEMLAKGKRYIGIPAVGLKNQLEDPRYEDIVTNHSALKAGVEGEVRTSEMLRRWLKEHPAAVLIDSVHLPLGKDEESELDEETGEVQILGDTDHVLILGKTVYIIDSKNWKRGVYSVTEDGEIQRGKKSFPGNRPKATQNTHLWKRYLENAVYDKLENYICITNDKATVIRDRTWWKQPYRLVTQDLEDGLIYFLNREVNRSTYVEPTTIDVGLVTKVAMGIQKPYNYIRENHPDFYKKSGGSVRK